MRWLGMIFAPLTALCLLCSPTLAQSSPSASQYEPGTCPPGPAGCTTSGVNDAPEAFVANAEQGTDALNDAMEDASVPTDASASASAPGDASAPRAPSSPEDDPTSGDTGAPDGITELPETGGAPLMVLGAGLVLATLGLMARKVVGR